MIITTLNIFFGEIYHFCDRRVRCLSLALKTEVKDILPDVIIRILIIIRKRRKKKTKTKTMRIPFHKKLSGSLKGLGRNDSNSSLDNNNNNRSPSNNNNNGGCLKQRRQGVTQNNNEAHAEQFQEQFKDFVLPKQRKVGVMHGDETKRR